MSLPFVRAAALALGVLLGATACTDAPPPVPPEVAAVAEDLDAFWEQTLPGAVDDTPEVVVADGDLDTGCGRAEQEEGSFFCAEDSTIYLQQVDLDDLAERSAREQEAGRVYLLAHEYAHVVQVEVGVDEGDAGPGPDGDSVRYELQADCLAGAYVASRADAGDLVVLLAVVREGGDDVGEEPLAPAAYEHGTAAQRAAAFGRGARSGPDACDLPAA